jgi:ABC-type multidrug transport system permease subunit
MTQLPGNGPELKRFDGDDAAEPFTMSHAATRRTKVCIWIIILGLANFFIYALLYLFINGEAVNGHRDPVSGGYFLQSGERVSKGVFIYSGIHSISVWVTVASVMLAMLTLAKDRIVSSMRSTILHGRTFITILATIITFAVAVITIWFILQFARNLAHPLSPNEPQTIRAAGQQ